MTGLNFFLTILLLFYQVASPDTHKSPVPVKRAPAVLLEHADPGAVFGPMVSLAPKSLWNQAYLDYWRNLLYLSLVEERISLLKNIEPLANLWRADRLFIQKKRWELSPDRYPIRRYVYQFAFVFLTYNFVLGLLYLFLPPLFVPLVGALVLAPIFEEIMFRHLLFKKIMLPRLGYEKALYRSSLWFGLIHIMNWVGFGFHLGIIWLALFHVLFAYVVGKSLARVYYFTNRLSLSIGLHFFINAFSTFLLLLFGHPLISNLYLYLFVFLSLPSLVPLIGYFTLKNKRTPHHKRWHVTRDMLNALRPGLAGPWARLEKYPLIREEILTNLFPRYPSYQKRLREIFKVNPIEAEFYRNKGALIQAITEATIKLKESEATPEDIKAWEKEIDAILGKLGSVTSHLPLTKHEWLFYEIVFKVKKELSKGLFQTIDWPEYAPLIQMAA